VAPDREAGLQDTDAAEAATPRRAWPAGAAALCVMLLLFIAFFFRALPLELDPVRTTNSAAQFDTERAIGRLASILDGKPHPVDSVALDSTRARLLDTIKSLGFTPEVHDETGCGGSISGSVIRCARVQNITFAAGPADNDANGPALVLTAHYDSVEASPGAGDDGVGVAVWLEVAKHFRDTPPAKPVLFLLTDGEEAALLGAYAFADNKAYGHKIGRIINLEARGNRGPAMMFETSHPNQGVVSDWARNFNRPASNSMMTAVYELLPNSTDLTVHLHQGFAGINIAIGDGLPFYHTAHDDLAHLDHRSVQHMGDQALGAARNFLASDGQAKGEIAYSDIATRIFIMLPQQIALMLLGLAAGVAALLIMMPARDITWRQFSWRFFALPPAMIVASGAIAWATAEGIGLVRSEPEYWMAHSQALNSAIFFGALIATALGLRFLAQDARREQLFAVGWFWFLALGVTLSIRVPGMSMVFLIPAIAFVVAAVVARFVPRLTLAAHAVAGAVLLLVFLPLIHLVDVMMGLGLAAVFGVLEAMVLGSFLSTIGPINTDGQKLIFSALGGAYVLAVMLTIFLPAYSADRPLALDLTAHYDMDAHKAQLVATDDPGALPKAIRDQLDQPPIAAIPGIAVKFPNMAIPFEDRPFASATATREPVTGGPVVMTIQLKAPGAQQIRLRIPEEARPISLQYGSGPHALPMTRPTAGYYIFDCVGRSCDGGVVHLTLAAPAASQSATQTPAPWLVQGYWGGLPPEGQAVAALRTDAAVPIQSGDLIMTTKRFIP
jgi:hypothetical protein